MTTYRVYPTDPNTWVEFIVHFEADNDEEARAKALLEADLTEADLEDFTIAPLPTEMESECVCSEKPVLFKLITPDKPDEMDPPQVWECQNCQCVFIFPPDEINWEHERMFAKGYVPCGCDHYDIRCRCQGAGWYRPGDDDDNGYVARFEDDDDDDDPYYDDPYYDPNLELELGD